MGTPGMRLQGRVAIITGAARGIGLAIAKAYAEEGASVWLADVHGGEVEAAVDAIRADDGKADGGYCDVRSTDSVRDAVDAAARSANATPA